MKLWLMLDEDNYTPAMESIDPDLINKMHLEPLFWRRCILTSLTETGRLRSNIFKGILRHTISLYRLRNYRDYQLHGINVEKIDAFVDANTAEYLMPHVDMIYVIRVVGKHEWRYGRFDFPKDFKMVDSTVWHYYSKNEVRIERWSKTSD